MTGRASTGRQSTAVMASRAPKSLEDLDPQRAQWRRLDFFPTPPWAARAGFELVRGLDPAPPVLRVWEPGCGQGHMAWALQDMGALVYASDIHPHGYGDVFDFLQSGELFGVLGGGDAARTTDWVITNPPFKDAAGFVRRGLKVAQRGVAMLVRLSFIESADRYDLLFGGETPVSVVAPFIERVPMQLGSYDPKLSTATAYAWFVWLKGRASAAPIIRPIPPGTRRRLTRKDDARHWGAEAVAAHQAETSPP